MKRELIQNVKVIPFKSGDAIDRERFLSGILAVSLGSATGEPTGITVKIAVTECDTQGGGYTAVKDKHVFIDHTADGEGAITLTADKSGNELHNLGLQEVHQDHRHRELHRRHVSYVRRRLCDCAGRQCRPARVRRADYVSRV